MLFWLSQSISELGSSMTGFALILWAYARTQSAMTVSLLTFFSYLPYVAVSLFAGAFTDRHRKKPILLWTDSIASLCSLTVLALFFTGKFEIWQIYLVNAVTGAMNAFQLPATAVAVGRLVPREQYEKVSGMNSFSKSMITVATPTLAAFASSFFGLAGVLAFDLLTFFFAFSVLLFRIRIPEHRAHREQTERRHLLTDCREGFRFLVSRRGLLSLIFSMAVMNFFSNITYENILPAMILSRSGQNEMTLGVVSGLIGFGGVLGGLIVSFVKLPENKIRLIYFSAAFSFLFGDVLMGLGRTVPVWIVAALAASVPIPFVAAGQNVILYHTVPEEIQGRVFAVRNAVQFGTIPLGTLLGGALADYVFEPFMKSRSPLAVTLQKLVGSGSGSGMAVMFLCTGVLGFLLSVCWYRSRNLKSLREK
ncbi:Transmembrane secretion effector [Caprobacter fermentans]|uniref:Transmembrane secretion effector n=1 Tax=Caproicibacter fermentans TaxID=2576756 RepID=A0A6N8I422_9FIRM|nr:MFS transporter [Caproicibacter fermentans]MVB12695.1 Transmembrane secretion effector [Caproicibacter fermentans]